MPEITPFNELTPAQQKEFFELTETSPEDFLPKKKKKKADEPVESNDAEVVTESDSANEN